MLDDAQSNYHYRVGYFVTRTLHEHESKFDGTVGLVDNMDDRGRVYVLWVEGKAGWYYPSQVSAFDVADYDLDSDAEYDGADMLATEVNLDDDIIYVQDRVARPDYEDQHEWECESMVGEGEQFPRLFLYDCDPEEEEDVNEDGHHSGNDENYEEDEDSSSDSGSDSDEDEDDGDEASDAEEDSEGAHGDSLDKASREIQSIDISHQRTQYDSDLSRAIEESMKSFKKKKDDEEHEEAKKSTTMAKEAGETSSSSLAPPHLHHDASTSSHDDELSTFRFGDPVPSNHKYASARPATSTSLPKLAMKEWQLLQEATLDGAYMIAYEERVDLFRFMVLGAQGTPFYLSWFMFDLQLDAHHPASPPRVYYHSLGPKLHPNLYEDGNVCLSLLGTWSGSGVEVWDAAHSNILQVVLSIQGLILGVKEPYYLEAGYDKHRGTPEGAANSLVYNERSFLLSVQQMKKLIEHPPPEFKTLIHHTFKQHQSLLLSLEAALSTDQEVLHNIDMTMYGLPKGPPSIGFRSAFKGIFPSVKRALESLH